MSWHEKEQSTQFDDKPIEGLWFLDGDILSRELNQSWTKGQKYPVIVFPSGQQCDIWESGDPQNVGTIHLYGEMDLRYNDTRDEAYEHAQYVAEQCGYFVQKIGDNQLKLVGHDPDEQMIVTYDNDEKRMVDVVLVEDEPYEPPVHPGHQLMTDEIREQLPKLYSNEEKGLAAPAPVKYFSPDSGWTWYASEFDGEDLFFGLVSGHEVELGYFSLSELQSVRGPMGLQIERDLYYEPKSLRELQDMHKRDR